MSAILPPGRVIERYVVEEILGEGGTAIVYRVRHVQLRTLHALKVLSLRGSQAAVRLLLEGRVQAGLRHPNIVAVTDVLDIDGMPGLLMEYVPPPTLARWIGDPRSNAAQADALFRDIVDGVHHAHLHGLVHRDLKPSNVLLAAVEPGGRLVAKVADFGLAKLLGDEAAPDHTRSGLSMGTPQYMAPEQYRDAKNVDRRADMFSLGCILYELHTGHAPFPGLDLITLYEMIRSRGYARIPDGVADPVRRAIEGCLDPDRDARIGDCATLLATLDGRPARPLTLVPRGDVAGILDAAWTPPALPDAEAPPTAVPPDNTWMELSIDDDAATLPPDPRDTIVSTPHAPRAPYVPRVPPIAAAPAPSERGVRRVALAAGLLAIVALAVWALFPAGQAPAAAPPVAALPAPAAPAVAVPSGAASSGAASSGAPSSGAATSTEHLDDATIAGRGAGLSPAPPRAAPRPPGPPSTSAIAVAAGIPQPAPPAAPPEPAPPEPAPPEPAPPEPASAGTESPSPARPVATVTMSGARAAWVVDTDGARISVPGRVPPGRYAVRADFGAGGVVAGQVELQGGDTVELACSESFQTCRVRR